MSFDLAKVLDAKRRHRERLAARPVAEKLAMLDVLRARLLEIRAARTSDRRRSQGPCGAGGAPQPLTRDDDLLADALEPER